MARDSISCTPAAETAVQLGPTDLGTSTHHYWWENNLYYRRPLAGGNEQVWNGAAWVSTCIVTESIWKLAA